MSLDLAGHAIARGAGRGGFGSRAQQAERMDQPSSYAELRACLDELARVHRWLGTERPILRWLAAIPPGPEPLHIVDVGCGRGDLLRAIEAWAARRGRAVRLTGVDLNPDALRAARATTPPGSRIRWRAGDALSLDGASERIDVVVSSLFAHHLSDSDLVLFVRWMERTATSGWLVSDLYRSRVAYAVFKAIANTLRLHPFVRHDGPLSIRRALRPREWRRIAANAGLPAHAVSVAAGWPVRIHVSRVKQP